MGASAGTARPSFRRISTFRSSSMAYRQGTRIRVRRVAKESPHTTEMAMGERNLAWPLEKKARGIRPPTVVTVVSSTGRRRAVPEARIASSREIPASRDRLIKSTRMRESFTTTPTSATRPIIERKLRGSPIMRWPMTTPARAKGMAAITMNGWMNDWKSEPRMK